MSGRASGSGFVAVVPAAGRSLRMGRDKLLLGWGRTSVIGSVVEALTEGGAGTVVIVAARESSPLGDWVRSSGHLLAVNRDPVRGMLSSVVEGLDLLGGAGRLAATARGLLVCPGDHAGLAAPTVAAVCAAVGGGAGLAVPTHGGRRGHPLAIAPELVEEIPHLDLGVGLKQLLERHASALVEVPVDDAAAVRDLDTPEDYEAARRDDR